MTPMQACTSDHSTTPNAVALLCDSNILLTPIHARCRCVWQTHASGARLVGANHTKWTLYLHLALEVSLLFRQGFIVHKSILLPELVCAELTTQVFKPRIPALTASQARAVSVCAADIWHTASPERHRCLTHLTLRSSHCR